MLSHSLVVPRSTEGGREGGAVNGNDEDGEEDAERERLDAETGEEDIVGLFRRCWRALPFHLGRLRDADQRGSADLDDGCVSALCPLFRMQLQMAP